MISCHHVGRSKAPRAWKIDEWIFLYTSPSDLPRAELRTKSGGARASTKLTASGFSEAQSARTPSRMNSAGNGPDANPPEKNYNFELIMITKN